MCNPFVDYFWSKSAYMLLEKHDAHDPTSEPNALRALHASLPSMKTAPTTENSKDIQPRTPSDASLNRENV